VTGIGQVRFAPRWLGTVSSSPQGRVAEGLFVLLLAWLMLQLGHDPPPLHSDSHEDLLLARACLERQECPGAGAMTSWPGIAQGALWVNLLAAMRALGIPVGAIHSATLGMAALGTAVGFAAVRERGAVEAWCFAGVAVLALVGGGTLGVLWNPSLMPLPAALMFALCLRASGTRRWWDALSVGLALALTFEGHPVAALAVPGALAAVGLSAPSRAAALAGPPLTLAVALGVHWLMSPVAVATNLATLLGVFGPGTILAALAVFVGAVAWLRPRWRSRLLADAPLLTAALLAVPGLLGFAYRALVGGAVGPRYLGAVTLPVAYLATRALGSSVGARGTVALLLAGGLVIGVALRQRTPELSLPMLEGAVQQWTREGLSLDDVLARTSGPRCRNVVAAAAATGAPIVPSAAMRRVVSDESDFVLSLAPDPSVAGRPRRLAGLVVTKVRPWLRRRRFTACVQTEVPVCVERDLTAGIDTLMGDDPWMLPRLSEPSLHWTDERLARRPASPVTYRFAISVPASSGAREITLPRRAHGCAARFVALSGVEGTRDRDRLVLRSVQRPQRGHVTVAVDPGCGGAALVIFPPCTLERTLP